MLLRVIAAFCIIDDALQAMGHKGQLPCWPPDQSALQRHPHPGRPL